MTHYNWFLRNLGLNSMADHPWITIMLMVCCIAIIAGLFRFRQGRPLARFSRKLGKPILLLIEFMLFVMTLSYVSMFLYATVLSPYLGWIPGIGSELTAGISLVCMSMVALLYLYLRMELASKEQLKEDAAGWGAMFQGYFGPRMRYRERVPPWKGNGPHGVKWTYQLAIAFAFALALCYPAWNAPLYYMPALIFGLFGLGVFVYSTAVGKKLVD